MAPPPAKGGPDPPVRLTASPTRAPSQTAAHTDIFFCTLEEKEPWVEIDLGKPTAFSVVEVVNRMDCCPDRAVPLVVEVSTDQNKWREVSRRKDTFSTWKTSFSPQTARYVRLRATRRTILHLEKVSVRAG